MEQPGVIETAERDFSLRVSLGLLAVVILGGLVFVVETDSWYLFWKALHVLSAVAWVGGGLTLTLLVIRTERSRDTNRLLDLGDHADWVGTKVFVPATLLVLARVSR
jgi:hypothetical protein